jgi:hypothetical protein
LLSTIFTTSTSRHPEHNFNVRSIAEPFACSQICTSSGPARLLLRSFRTYFGFELENCDDREEATALPQTSALTGSDSDCASLRLGLLRTAPFGRPCPFREARSSVGVSLLHTNTSRSCQAVRLTSFGLRTVCAHTHTSQSSQRSSAANVYHSPMHFGSGCRTRSRPLQLEGFHFIGFPFRSECATLSVACMLGASLDLQTTSFVRPCGKRTVNAADCRYLHRVLAGCIGF